MKLKVKTKSIIKKVALALAGVVAITAVGFGVKAIVDYTKNDLQTANLSYDVGNLGSDGKYVNDESTLYTKEAFACYGLQVKPDFDSTVNYQIFYYDILDNYISATEIMSDGYSGEAPVNGAYARIVIEPREDEDGKISFTEKIKYPSQLEIKVKKNQDINGRYGVFKGKVLQVVSDTDSLVFTNNVWFSPETMTWKPDDLYCATATTVLKVDGGSKITFDKSRLDESYQNAFYRVYQFKGLPLDDNVNVNNFGISGQTPITFFKDTKYIIISVHTNAEQLKWTDTQLSKLSSCFTITKN